MNELTLIKSAEFGEIQCDFYGKDNEIYMTISQLAECLEYADKKGVENLIDRNPYLRNEEFSFIQKVPLISGGYPIHPYLYRGRHLRSNHAVQNRESQRVPGLGAEDTQVSALRQGRSGGDDRVSADDGTDPR